jgi:hypothetical protein
MTRPTKCDLLERSALAALFGRYPRARAASSTAARVSAEISDDPLNARDAVLRETPAALATSIKVTAIGSPSLASRLGQTYSTVVALQVRFRLDDSTTPKAVYAIDPTNAGTTRRR